SARLQWGTTPENDTRLNRLRWVEMQLLTAQLRGEHTEMFGLPLRADWRYMLSTASRDEPDRREIAYLLEPAASSPVNRTTYRLDELDIFNQRFYSTLADLIHDVGADVELNVPIVGEVETKFKAGVAMLLKTRDVETRRLGYDPRNSLFSTLPASEIFNEESLGGDRPSFLLEEVTENTDSYTASQDVFAGYLMTDFGLLENLRVLGGARVEASTQRVETFLPDGEPTPGLDPSELNTFDVLPALTLTWEFIQDMQLRFAASRTLSRPNLRELSPARFREFGGALILEGNPNLERTLIWNLDARYEWYPSPGESFSTSFFYKRFENPVERTGSTGATPTFRPINIDSAFVVGGEIDTRVEFGFIDDVLADLYFAGNLTVVFSEVQIPPEEQGALTTLERPMALQSPWVINAQVGYDNPEIGLSASLLYNLFGPRIWAVGTLEAPDFYEQPFDQLDAVINWKVDRFKFTVKGKNLMDPVARVTQEQPTDGTEFLVQAFRRGRVFSIGIGVDLN
ncbi:MAG: TonB-dependent receptor, partial [Myxococcota bacterium]